MRVKPSLGVLTLVFLLVYAGKEGLSQNLARSREPGGVPLHFFACSKHHRTIFKTESLKAGCQYSNLQIGLLFSGSWFTWDGSCFLTRPQSHVVHLKTQPVIWQFPFCICNEANAGTKSSAAFLSRNNHTLLHREWYSRGDYKHKDREFLYLELADVGFSLLLQLQFRAGTVVFTSWIF